MTALVVWAMATVAITAGAFMTWGLGPALLAFGTGMALLLLIWNMPA